MHGSVLNFMNQCVTSEEVIGRRVLEVGSCNVNGTPRTVIEALKPAAYVGIDSSIGPCVDVVMKAEDLTSHFGVESFDIVISTELLEHVVNWKRIVSEMKRATKPNGLLILTTRSPGFPYHPFPIDVWRYTTEDFGKIFCDMIIQVLVPDQDMPGVFMKARKPENFQEADLSRVEVTAMEKP
jgi:SAM-dependent methyltransferase